MLAELEKMPVVQDVIERAQKEIEAKTGVAVHLNIWKRYEHVSIVQVCETTCEILSIKKEDLLGSCKSNELVFGRMIAAYFCKKYLQMTYQAIGKHFCKDHTTIMHSVNGAKLMLETEHMPFVSRFKLVELALKESVFN